MDGPDGSLSEPRPTAAVLAELPRGYSLVMVATPAPPSPSPPGAPVLIRPPAAICRLVDTQAAAAAEAEAEKKLQEEKKLMRQSKTLELNYAIAAHDLGHKMKRLNEFLAKGLRVEILLARKRGSRKTTPEEESKLVESVREVALAVPGATEYKKMDGVVGKVVTLFFAGPNKKKTKAGAGAVAEEEVSKEVSEGVSDREATAQ